MRKKLFLSGGTGFFGKSILARAKQGHLAEYEFTILSRDPGRFLQDHPEFSGMKQLHFLSGDIRDFRFPDGHFDLVLHAGAPAMAMPPGVEREIILAGTRRMLEFAGHCGAEKMLFASSGAVYGPQPPELEKLPETFPCRPTTEYGIAKREAEAICLASPVPTVIARGFAFTGVYLKRDIHFAIGNFLRDALAGKPIVIRGDGTPVRSYLHADDLVDWLFALLENGREGEAYNVGADFPVTIRELAEHVRETLHSSSEIQLLQQPDPAGKNSRYLPETGKIRRELKVRVRYSLTEAILHSLTEAEKKAHNLPG